MILKLVVGSLVAFLPALTASTLLKERNETWKPVKSIKFSSCATNQSLTSDFECGSLTVPIDYDNPDDGTVELWVSRWKANGTSKSLGNLVFNYGGPGGAASSNFQDLAAGFPLFSQEILEKYNIIALDPRGIGYSDRLSCDKDVWNNVPSAFAFNESSYQELVEFNKAFGESCLNLTGPLASFMDSVSTTKDFDVLREALGDEKFNYIGFSYGTLLGQMYAEQFPQRVGRMVLDALVDHSSDNAAGLIITEALTYQATLEKFFSLCNETTECSLSGKDLPAIWKDLTTAASLPAPQCKGSCRTTVTGENILFNAQEYLLFVDSVSGSWSELADALNETLHGDASAFSLAVETTNIGGSNFPNRAVMCQDWGSTLTSVEDLKVIRDISSALVPLTLGACEAWTADAYCAGWPAPVRNPPHKLDSKQVEKLPKMLLVNTFVDPETSTVWAEGVREQLPTAVSIWRNGAGHTSYLLYGETTKVMDSFLINRTLPTDGSIFDS